MKKNLFLAAFLLLAGVLTAFAQQRFEAHDPDWSVRVFVLCNQADKTATITYALKEDGSIAADTYGDDEFYGEFKIPAEVYVNDTGDDEHLTLYRVTAIGDSAFAYCSNLKHILFPKSITSFGVNAFLGCDNIEVITFADGKEPLAFRKAMLNEMAYVSLDEISHKCKQLYLGRNITAESLPPFHGWEALEYLVIGKEVTTLSDGFMQMARGIKSVQINRAEPIAKAAMMFGFVEDLSGVKLLVPRGAKAAYEAADGWSDFNIQEMDIARQLGFEFMPITETTQDRFDPTDYDQYPAWVSYWEENEDGVLLFYADLDGYNDYAHGYMLTSPAIVHIYPDGSHKYENFWPSYKYNFTGTLHIPSHVNGKPVTQIAGGLFLNERELEEVIIPNTMEYIHDWAFQGTVNLKKLVIPESVSKMGGEMFSLSGLEEVWIPATAGNWKAKTFWCTYDLKTVHFAEGLTSLPEEMFYYCNNLESLTFPSTLETIEKKAFFMCEKLKEINFNEGLKSIGISAFANCSALESVHLPSTVWNIDNNAFQNCKSLADVQLPSGIQRMVNQYLFENTPVRRLVIPASCEYINLWALYGMNDLIQLSVEKGNSVYDSRSNCNAIIETATNTLVVGCNGTFIPEGVEAIAQQALLNAGMLRSLTFPSSMKTISHMAFDGCNNLQMLTSNITNPAGVMHDGAIIGSDEELPVLYVPAGTKALYEADYSWKDQVRDIIEMTAENKPASVEDLVPVTKNGNADFSQLPPATDLGNALLGNIYVTCDTKNGDGYDATEQAVVFKTVVDDVMLENVLGAEGNMDVIRNNFSGMIVEIPAGKGTVKIEVKVEGARALAVYVSGGVGLKTFTPASKQEVEVTYDLAQKAYAYIYAVYQSGSSSAPRRAPSKVLRAPVAAADGTLRAPKAANDENLTAGAVSIYGAKWILDEVLTDVEAAENTDAALTQKILRNGEVLILRDGKLYNMFGTQVQ